MDLDMNMNPPGSYRVEVSGWDTRESFFVEKTRLEWKPEDKKAILLRSEIRPGCIVFVRLLQPTTTGATYPIPYEAVPGAAKDENGATRVALERLRPRASFRETYAENGMTVKVA